MMGCIVALFPACFFKVWVPFYSGHSTDKETVYQSEYATEKRVILSNRVAQQTTIHMVPVADIR
jgi:hypothetical protein